MLPKPRSASETPSEGWSRQLTALAALLFLWPSETAVRHPQTLPTLPKPRSASETAAAPPTVFYDLSKLLFPTLPTLPKPRSASETAAAPPRVFSDLPKLLFGTPKRFQAFQNLAAPQRLLLRLRQSFMTFRNCCLAPPNPSNPSNPSKTSQRLRDCCCASESLL